MSDIHIYQTCSSSYRQFLEEVNGWLGRFSFNKQDIEFDFELMMKHFEGDIAWLKSLRDDYISMKITKLELAELVNSDRVMLLIRSIEKEFTDIQTKIINPIREFTDEAELEVTRAYIFMLQYVSTYKEFFRKADTFEKKAKRLTMWQVPLPNIETPQVKFTQ